MILASDMRVVFMGTPDYAARTLAYLCDRGINVVGAVSQPDRKKGRGMAVVKTPVKEEAERRGIRVFQPEIIKNGEMLPFLEETKPDIIIVAAYGKILPEYILNFPKYGCVNSHASLLPKYRGAAPIQRAIIEGERETGVSAMKMEKGLDTGDVILVKKVKIEPFDTSETLHDKLAEISGSVMESVIEKFEKGDFSSQKQDDSLATYAPMLTKAEGEIDWTKSKREIMNLIRGMNPWPMAYTYYKGKRFIPYDCEEARGEGEAGEIIEAGSGGIAAACADGAVRIRAVKFDGKKKMSVHDYLVGNKIDKGEKLGI